MDHQRFKQIAVLLVEDSHEDADLFQRMLTKEYPDGFNITSATTLQAACATLAESPFDVVVTDLGLPDSSDLNTVSELLAVNPQIPVIVLTGNDDQELAVDIVKHGAQDYLVKGQGDGHLISRAIRYAIERKQLQLEIINASMVDTLTGLTKRGMFYDHLKKILKRSIRNKTRFAVLFIDIDRFKEINDDYGHLAGDTVLKEISERMGSCMRGSDTLSRFAGDEFTVLVDDITDNDSVLAIVEKLRESCKTPVIFKYKNKSGKTETAEINVNLSIGIAIYPDDNIYHDELMMHADMAMYEAKRRGSNQHVFFSEISQNQLRNN